MAETSRAVGIGTRCRLDPHWARRAERTSREADANWPSASPPSGMNDAGSGADSLLGNALRSPMPCAARCTAQPHAQCGLMHHAAKGAAQPRKPRSAAPSRMVTKGADAAPPALQDPLQGASRYGTGWRGAWAAGRPGRTGPSPVTEMHPALEHTPLRPPSNRWRRVTLNERFCIQP